MRLRCSSCTLLPWAAIQQLITQVLASTKYSYSLRSIYRKHLFVGLALPLRRFIYCLYFLPSPRCCIPAVTLAMILAAEQATITLARQEVKRFAGGGAGVRAGAMSGNCKVRNMVYIHTLYMSPVQSQVAAGSLKIFPSLSTYNIACMLCSVAP